CRGGSEPCSLWSSDGSRGGTREILQESGALRSIRSLTGAGGHLFFLADLGGRRALWGADGTGPHSLVDFAANATPPVLLTAAGDRLFFVGDDGKDRQELWVSDGTPAGPRGIPPLGPSQPSPHTDSLT